jgi:hypothetical protein
MTENISDSTLVELDADKLVALSDQWANSTQKCNKLRKKIDIIRTLEVGIRALVASGYSYDAVCEKLKDELHFIISNPTLRQYLKKISEEKKKLNLEKNAPPQNQFEHYTRLNR